MRRQRSENEVDLITKCVKLDSEVERSMGLNLLEASGPSRSTRKIEANKLVPVGIMIIEGQATDNIN